MAIIRYPQQTPRVASNPFADAGTYIIEDAVIISQDTNIHSDVTLIFIGEGKITSQSNSSYKIIGNYTRLIAPISQIFSEHIKVEGNWTIDRSYPQWFYNQAYDYTFTESATLAFSIDWAPSINKAIVMKKTGEVFLPRGRYFIKSPIELRFAINLIGERGRYIANPSDDNNTNGTVIEATSNNFTGDSLIHVNKSGETWKVNYPPAITRITNLRLLNNECYHKRGLFGIVSYGACIVDSCQFDGLCCGIKFNENLYSDKKQVYNSSFTFDHINDSETTDKTYAIDCSCLGDGILLSNNHVLYSEHVGALRLSSCGGGVISSNIFNSDVYIGSCRGIVYEANHMENGAQLQIRKSDAVVRANFMEKGKEPSIVVWSESGHNCNVNLENNQYLSFEYVKREETETPANSLNRIRRLCEYDIAVDENSSISIKNEFRYPIVKKLGFHGIFAMGIQISKYPKVNDAWVSLTDFNNISYMLSKESLIDNYRVRYPNLLSVGTITKPAIHAGSPNTNVQWLADTGYYNYIISYKNDSGQTITETSNVTQLVHNEGTPVIENGQNKCGYLFTTGNTIRETIVTITRRRLQTPSSQQPITVNTATLHISGATVLYDNGITISGYKWR